MRLYTTLFQLITEILIKLEAIRMISKKRAREIKNMPEKKSGGHM